MHHGHLCLISPAAQAGTITLGGDLTVNRMGFGAMRITGKGIWGPPDDVDAALATLRRAVELGVNFIDTADSYGPDVSEELIAEALWPYPAGLVIATKAGWARHGPGVWQHNASPAHIEEAIEGSLKRLRLERIDVYQLHVPDPAVSFDASMEALRGSRSRARFATSGSPTSRSSTFNARRRSSPSSACRTATASPIASGILCSTTAGQRHRFSALGTDGAGPKSERGGGKDRRRAQCFHGGRFAGVAAAPFAGRAAHSRHQQREAP